MLTETPLSKSTIEDRSPTPASRNSGDRTQRSPKNRTTQRILLVLGGVLAAAALVTVVYFTSFREDTTAAPVTQVDQTTTPDSTIPPDTTQADTGTPVVAANPVLDPLATLTSFGSMWDSADWAGLESMSNADVVATAREWHQDGGHLVVDAQFVPDQCTTEAAGVASCELLYAPVDGYGLIFNFTLEPTPAGGSVTQLTFGGDAG